MLALKTKLLQLQVSKIRESSTQPPSFIVVSQYRTYSDLWALLSVFLSFQQLLRRRFVASYTPGCQGTQTLRMYAIATYS